MHELSIVEALIEQVEREVKRAGQQGRVVELYLSVGRLSGVNVDSIRFAVELLAPGTAIEGAELHVTEPPAVCECRQCGAATEIEQLVTQCPACGSDQVQITGGRDLTLDSIELETAESPP